MTDDTSLLAVDDARVFIDYGDTELQYYGVYSFHNPTDKTVLVDTKGNTEIPFIKMPEGTSSMGYETLQDSEPRSIRIRASPSHPVIMPTACSLSHPSPKRKNTILHSSSSYPPPISLFSCRKV